MRFFIAVAALLAGLTVSDALARQFIAKESDFTCIRSWPKVNHTRVFNKNKHRLKKAMHIIEQGLPNKKFPVGTILQLWPGEASVKRGGKFNPDGDGWEFFALKTTAQGTTITDRGIHTKNAFGGGECVTCHAAARTFDFFCEHGHGCIELPLGDAVFDSLQQGDPRCPPAN